jgi:hypothetical protein
MHSTVVRPRLLPLALLTALAAVSVAALDSPFLEAMK